MLRINQVYRITAVPAVNVETVDKQVTGSRDGSLKRIDGEHECPGGM